MKQFETDPLALGMTKRVCVYYIMYSSEKWQYMSENKC
jgi:hypothetical protein